MDPRPYQHDDYDFMKRTLTSMKNYRDDNRISYKHRSLSVCPLQHQTKLMDAGYGDYLKNVTDCIENNQIVLDEILAFAESQMDVSTEGKEIKTLSQDHSRVRELFRQIVREWCEEGRDERRQSFAPLLDELNSLYPDEKARASVRILVPGCGLARLPFDIALAGFHCLANEQSYHMLMTAEFILNRCERTAKYRIYPWVHNLTNVLNANDITAPVAFPDISPTQTPDGFQLEVLPGDFSDVCRPENLEQPVSCVVTSFFLDSAHNVLDFIKLIGDALEPGGFWLNLGPLNYVYAGFSDVEMSIQLTWETLRESIVEAGFKFVKESFVDNSYGSNERSMTAVQYKCPFFVCQKK
jgi:carnosine N-methyltransferase